jgi:excisionase family DNA binding protein
MTKLTVTLTEAQAMTGLSRSTFYRAFASKKISARKAGKRTLILVSELEEYIRSLPVAA